MDSIAEGFHLIEGCALIRLWQNKAKNKLIIYAPFERWQGYGKDKQAARAVSVEGYFSFRGRNVRNIDRYKFTPPLFDENVAACHQWMKDCTLRLYPGAVAVMEAVLDDPDILLPIVMALKANLSQARLEDPDGVFRKAELWNEVHR